MSIFDNFKNLWANKAAPDAPAASAGKPDLTEIAIAQIQDKYSDYPSDGLTPMRLANIFKEADTGDVLRQMELFEEMEGKDPHLFSQLQTRKNAVTGLDYEVIPFSADNETDKIIAEFVEKELSSIENFEDVTMDLLDAIGKGIAVSEIIWGYDEGHVVIQDIKNRHQKRFFWDIDDNFKVYTKNFPAGILVPENKFIVHRYKARSGHASKAGVLRVIAWMYLFKNYDVKDWVSFCEVFGMPLRLGTYAQGSSEDDKNALMRALVQIGTDAAGIIPDGTQIEFKESGKTSSIDVYERLARFCDEQMSKAIVGQTLTSDSGGSYSQSKTHNDVRHDLTLADCKALAATLRRDLIRPLVMFNFGEDRRIPSIRYACEEAEDLEQLATIYESLITKIGLKVPTSHLYKKFSIPKPETGDEIAAPVPQAANPPTGGGNPPTGGEPEANGLPLKGGLFALKEAAGGTGTQQRIDNIATAAIRQSAGLFKKIFAPVMDRLEKSESLEEIKQLFDNDQLIGQLASEMNISDIDELLQRAMMYADMEGRAQDG